MSELGAFLRDARLKTGLSLGQLARLVGYRNISKGARRITCLEQTGTAKADLLVNVAEALDLDWTAVEHLAEEDRLDQLREWEAWVNEPVPMQLIVRLIPAVYSRKTVPAEITTHEEAEVWACVFAREHRHKVCLVLSRRHSVWIDAEGQVYARTEATPNLPNMPFMQVRGRRFFFSSE